MTQIAENEMPIVRTSKYKLQMFDSKRIRNSLMDETGMEYSLAKQVTDLVVKRIADSSIEWLSGPLIREMCCSVLAELRQHEFRKKYTRMGIPVADYRNLINNGIRENANQTYNPESLHYWSADKTSEQFALLDVLPEELSLGHLNGDYHVHKLRFLDLRPFCASWDLRMILKNGLPPGGSPHFAYSKPAKKPNVAFLHTAKWYGIIQGFFQGGQGYDNTCEYLAPYVVGMTEDEILQNCQCLIFETNQVYASRAQVPFTSIDTSPTISEELLDVPAIGPGGKTVGVYGDYQDECRKLFRAFSKVYQDGDGNGRLFNFPKHEVKLKKQWFEKFEEDYMEIMKEAVKFGTPYFLNHPDWLPAQLHSQCCRIIFTKEGVKRFCRDEDKFDVFKSYMNIGSLQSISLNLPRYAYQSNGNDDLFFDILRENWEKVVRILFLKKALTEDRLKKQRYDLLDNFVESPTDSSLQPLFDLDKYSLTIGFVGGNECAISHTGHPLHESDESFTFLKRVLETLAKWNEEISVERQYNVNLWEQPAESVAERFAKLDREQFPKKAIVQGDINNNKIYYTNSSHLAYNSDIGIVDRVVKQAEYQKIVKGGVITHVFLGESQPNKESLWKLTQNIARGDTAYFAYTFDFTQCLKCMQFIKGEHVKCPSCGNADPQKLEYWSRITGYYSRKSRWNDGKQAEDKDRVRYAYS